LHAKDVLHGNLTTQNVFITDKYEVRLLQRKVTTRLTPAMRRRSARRTSLRLIRIPIRYQRNPNWWTSEHTANADKDYISIDQETMVGASFDESSMLHIPLVDDSLSEPRESFFVNIGLLDTQQGQIERIAVVRVDIIDDDLP
jgi:hypothetical protein